MLTDDIRSSACDARPMAEKPKQPAKKPPEIYSRLRQVKESGLVKSMRDWGLSAGLKDGYLSGTLSRMSKGGQETIGTKELTMLAQAAKISVKWLAIGEGPMVEEETAAMPVTPAPPPVGQWVEYDERYPTRSAAVELARGEGVPDNVLRAVCRLYEGEGDPGKDFWITRIKELYRDSKKLRADLKQIDEESSKEWDEPSFDEAVKQERIRKKQS